MSPRRRYLVRTVRLEPLDDRILRDYAEQLELPPGDISAALRIVLREWFALRLKAASSQDRPQTVPPWDLRTEIQRIKATLHGCQPPAGYALEPPPPLPAGPAKKTLRVGEPVFGPAKRGFGERGLSLREVSGRGAGRLARELC